MMLKVSFAEIDEAYIRWKVAEGYYSTITEVIRDAVRKLREAEQNRLITALEVGESAIRENRTHIFTREWFEKTVADGLTRAESGKPPVCTDALPE